MKAFMLGTEDEGDDSDTAKARSISRLDQRNSGERTVCELKTGALVVSYQIRKTW
jgi:hypothetical protein